MTERTGKRILLIRLSAIGDVIVTTPVVRALREALPDAFLAWVVEPRAKDLLAGNPYLDDVIVWDRPKGALSPAMLWNAHRALKPYRFDCAIDFQGLMRSALLARLSGAREIIGNTGAKESAELLYTVRVRKSQEDLSNRKRCLDLLRPVGLASRDRRMFVPVEALHEGEAARILEEEGVPAGSGYACFVPATTWAQKHWFEDRWAALADLVRNRMGLVPVVMGAADDRPMAERIREQSAWGCAIVAGRTSLTTAAAVLRGAALTVSVDTALMHASVAVGTPPVALCGASYWPAFADYENFRVVREPLACSPCLRHPVCGGRFDCMRALDAERVYAAATEMLNRPNPLTVLSP
jgi:heptosyltransferase-1